MKKCNSSNVNSDLIIKACFLLLCFFIQYKVYAQEFQNFTFNNGSSNGWTSEGPFIVDGVDPSSSNFNPLEWTELTSYPNLINSDPGADLNGSIRISVDNGHGIISTNDWWIMRFRSPNLSSSSQWQNAQGYSIKVIQNMSDQINSFIYTNLFVSVYDHDLDSLRYFYNGTAQQNSKNSWNTFTFNNFTSESVFPSNYTLQDIFVNIWGTIDGYYNGEIYLDEVIIIPKPVPGIPVLNSPSNGSTIYTNLPTFDWSEVNNAMDYEIQIASDISFGESNLIYASTGTTSSYSKASFQDGIYYWRVRAGSLSGWSNWSSPWMLTISSNVPPPTLISPVNNTVTIDDTPTFTWESTISYFEIEIYKYGEGEDPYISDYCYTNYYNISESLPDGEYYWQVRAMDETEYWSEWSETWDLKIVSSLPIPNLNYPANGGQFTNTTPNFGWSFLTDAHYYEIQIDNSSNFSSPEISTFIISNDYIVPDQLENGQYYWRVRAYYGEEFGGWSSVWSFKISVPSITFYVNMNLYPLNDEDIIGLRGGISPLSWDRSIAMLDSDSDGIYEVEVGFDPSLMGSTLYYKFVIERIDSSIVWEGFVDPGGGEYGNRVVTITVGNIFLPVVYFNNISEDNPPVIHRVQRDVLVPEASQNTIITAEITDDIEIWEALLEYSVNSSDMKSIIMLDKGNNIFEAVIPNSEYNNGDIVNYKIAVKDNGEQWINSSGFNFIAGDINIADLKKVEIDSIYAKVKGVITAGSNVFATNYQTCYIQDETAGLNIFSMDNSYILREGRVYSIIGKFSEFRGLQQIVVDDFSNQIIYEGTGGVPDPETVTIEQILSDPEYYESKLVQINSAGVISGEWPSSGSNSALQISDDNGKNLLSMLVLRSTNIDEQLEPVWPQDIKGIISQRDSDYRILPRRYNDFSASGQFIFIDSPNEQSIWIGGTEDTIEWRDNIEENVKIELISNETVIRSITSSINSISPYPWDVPISLESKSDYQIKITSTSNEELYGISQHFTITQNPTIIIHNPDSETIWDAGKEYLVAWSDNIVDNLRIELYKGDDIVQVIATSTSSNKDNVQFTLEETLKSGSDYRVKISSISDSNIYDFSEYFEIRAVTTQELTITINKPDSNSNWSVGNDYLITWEDNFNDMVKIELLQSGVPIKIIDGSTESDGSYLWSITEEISPGGNYQVKITHINNNSVFNISEIFYISESQPEFITVNMPNKDSKWYAGESYNVVWTDNINDNIDIILYQNDVLIQNLINNISNDGQEQVKLPSNISGGENYLIRVVSTNNSSVYGLSEIFTIYKPILSVLDSEMNFNDDLIFMNTTLTNTGTGILKWNITTDRDWISVEPISGETISETDQIIINVNRQNLVEGTHKGNIYINSNGGNANIVVTLSKTDNNLPQLYIDKFILEFGNNKTELTFNIKNQGQGELIWSITENSEWISINPISGGTTSETDQINVTVNKSSMEPGLYSDEINIVSNGGNAVITANMEVSAGEPILALDKDVLNFGSTITDLEFNISNQGQSELTWNITENSDWLSITPVSGETTSESDQIDVSVNRSSIDPGIYSDTINIISNGGEGKILVNMEVPEIQIDEPILSISKTEIDFGNSKIEGSFKIHNIGTGILIWNISSNYNWINVETSSGELPSGSIDISVMVNRDALLDGNYEGKLLIYSNGGEQELSVYMKVGGELRVELSDVVLQNDLQVIVDLIENFEPSESNLFYRMGGQSNYSSVQLHLQGEHLIGNIPADFVTMRGIEYYVILSNELYFFSHPKSDFENNPERIVVSTDSFSPPLNFQAGQYQMISVPLVIEKNKISTIVSDDYGAFDNSIWRGFRWNSQQLEYDEFSPEYNWGMNPGYACWIITNNGQVFSIENCVSVSTANSYTITLQPGFNQIGNPFMFSVNWSSIENIDLLQAPIAWRLINGKFDYIYDVTILEPWEGCFVYNPQDHDVQLFVPPIEYSGSEDLSKQNFDYNLQEGEFIINLKAIGEVSKESDDQNFIGVIEYSKIGLGTEDFVEAPQIEPRLNLSIMEENIKYAGNFIPKIDNGATWKLLLSTKKVSERVILQIENLDRLPEDYFIRIIDYETHLPIDIIDNYCFLKAEKEYDKTYKIIVGNKNYIEKEILKNNLEINKFRLSQNYPNPFNPDTKIIYSIPKKCDVSLKVYDMLGIEIATLVNKKQSQGSYVINFRASDLTSGIYFYRLVAGDYISTKKMILIK